ncbi:positive regulation of nucleotide-binding oligomerization domain containing 1 signaling pathway [Mactra antiquata]
MACPRLSFCILFLTYEMTSLTRGSVTPDVPSCAADIDDKVLKCNYIPHDIPNGWTKVYIEMSHFDVVCNNASFQAKNWQQVKTLKIIYSDVTTHLQICRGCFQKLTNLQYIGLNVYNYFSVFPGSFIGTNSVQVLDMSGSQRLHWHEFLQALNETAVLPNLGEMNLDSVGIILGSVDLNKAVFDIAVFRSISRINFSGMQLSNLNLTALMTSMLHLKYLNVSNVNLNDFTFHVNPNFYNRLETLDLTDLIVPKYVTSDDFVVYNIHVPFVRFNANFQFLFTVETLNVSGIMRHAKVEIHNCELILNKFIPMRTTYIVMKRNNIKFLDIRVTGDLKYRNTSLKELDLSQNTMEILHPDVLSLFPNLESLRVAENSLNNMLQSDATLFEKLFNSNQKLKLLDLSSNNLESIPRRQFKENHALEVLVLSNNNLQCVHFIINNLAHLKTLDLRNNRISNLDSASLSNLDKLVLKLPSSQQFTLKINSNPISCSKCDSKPFIEWLTHTKCVDLSTDQLKCTAENENVENINESTVKNLTSICQRVPILVACLSVLGLVLVVGTITVYVIVRHRKIHLKHMKLEQLLHNIHQGQGQFEFVAMVSYNSEEEEFIRQNVLDQLNANLKEIVGTGPDRELVLIGDRYFRPGFMLHNEIAACLERVSMVILLITNSFCNSGYCLSELDQAWMQRKPMILMFKEEVEEDLMTPLMKNLYKNKARILWRLEDGEYVLKTTWKNICNSILEVIIK